MSPSSVLRRASIAVALLALPSLGLAAPTEEPVYANLSGAVVLENDRVLVQKFSIPPGQWTGRQAGHRNQLAVFIRGGVLAAKATGRSVLWRDGRVEWRDASNPGDEGVVNTGQTPVEIIWVTLKPWPRGAAPQAGSAPKYRYLNYPNIPGEDLLENDFVIAQRFTVNPGQWEGVHAHHPDMLYVHIRGGRWAARSKREAEHAYPDASPDGEVGWMPTIDLSEGHESGNVGNTPIDLVWVTLKQ